MQFRILNANTAQKLYQVRLITYKSCTGIGHRASGMIGQKYYNYSTGHDIREFHLRLQPLNASDDCALELWNLDYKKPSFEDEYNLKLVATLEPTMVAV